MSSKGDSLTIDEATDLLRNKWDITLYNKTRLEPGVATLLAKHPGPLDFESIEELSADDARSLAGHRGLLHLRSKFSLSDEALSALVEHAAPIIIRSPAELSEAQAEAFGRHKGTLDLRGVEHLTASTASRLAQHEGPLYLNDVGTLSPLSADALMQHKGPIYLLEVSQVSDEVAEMLAKHQGPVWTFPLAEMSERARALLREHRKRICNEQKLPLHSEHHKVAGTFDPAPAGEYNEWAFLYYPRPPVPAPVLVHVCWRSAWVKSADKRPPAELPQWFVALLPKIGECIENIYMGPLPGDAPAAYLLDVWIEIVDGEIHGINIDSVDAEGVYWSACVDVESFPAEYNISCWGGNHYESANHLARLPLNHPIFDSTLEGLKWWQRNTVERAHAETAVN